MLEILCESYIHTIVTLEWQMFQHLRDSGHENLELRPLMHYGRQTRPLRYDSHVWLHKESLQPLEQTGPVNEREREREREYL